MGTGPASSLPTLTAGGIGTVNACPRRLARHLDPQDRPRSAMNEGRFRLGKAIAEAVRAAHDLADHGGSAVADVLDDTPPPTLGREEARRFVTALEHYAELAEQRPGRLHARAGETITRPSRDGTWALKADVGLLIEGPGGDVELRRITPAPAPSDRRRQASDGDVARIAMLGPIVLGRTVRVVELFSEGRADVRVHEVTEAAVRQLRDRLVAEVDAARAQPERTATGWWCTTCACIPGCPEIPDTRIGTLLS